MVDNLNTDILVLKAMYDFEKNKQSYKVKDLAEVIAKERPGIGRTTVSSALDRLKNQRAVSRVGRQWQLEDRGRNRVKRYIDNEEEILVQLEIPHLGKIAAGPAVEMHSDAKDIYKLQMDLETEFAMEVVGDSMEGYRIFEGDIAIFRRLKENQWPTGKIAAIAVPTGTDVHSPEWLGKLLEQLDIDDPIDPPTLDGITLKLLDVSNQLRGSKGSIRTNFKPIGVLVRIVRKFE
jgi:SOS-response transcriptional repressor LexA